MSRYLYFAIAAIVISFIASAMAYPMMPDYIDSHWNAAGEANGQMSRFWGLFFVPILSTGLLLLFIAIPLIDPLKKNIASFRGYYDIFVLVFTAFMLYIHMLTIVWNLGYNFNLIAMMIPAFASLFYFMGTLMEHAKPNWFVGIRTPWTLSDPKVWESTHSLGGKLFKLAGVISLLGVFTNRWGLLFVMAPIILFSLYLTWFSYAEYAKRHRR